jgi:hypothetical protein
MPRSTTRTFRNVLIALATVLILIHLISAGQAWTTCSRIDIHGQADQHSRHSHHTATLSFGPDREIVCPQVEGAEHFVVIIKTGGTEALARIPTVLSTFGRCIPNLLIFSDLEEVIEGHQIHDVLQSVSAHYKGSAAEFDFQRRLQTAHLNGADLVALGQLEENEGQAWVLDKWKNIPMLHEAHRLHPEANWYLFIDADTFVSFSNVVQALRRVDYTLPLYLGSSNTYNDEFLFAYGGSGYIVSAGAAARFEDIYDEVHIAKWEAETNDTCCGDVMLGLAMKHAGVQLRNTSPSTQAEPTEKLSWTSHLWCEPSWTWHHVDSAFLQRMSDFDREWHNQYHRMHTFKDNFAQFVKPNVREWVDDWDNLSTDHVYHEPYKSSYLAGNATKQPSEPTSASTSDTLLAEQETPLQSRSSCQAACIDNERCVQWVWRADGSCSHHWSVKLGHQTSHSFSKAQENLTLLPSAVSGWVMDRVEALERSWNQQICRVRRPP